MKTRRKFLTDSGQAALMLAAFDTIFGSMLQSRAYAATTGDFKQFLHINFYSSPPRWHYDLILNPTNNANLFMKNKQVSNFYTGNSSRYDDTTYKLSKYDAGNVYVPYLLSQSVKLGNGQSVKGFDILDNMINIRGINIMNAAHGGANELHQAAVVGAPTITSLTADRAAMSASNPVQNVIRAATLNPSPATIFRSKQGHGNFRTDIRGNINNLVNIFSSLRPVSAAQGFNPTFVNNLGYLEDRLNTAMTSLDPEAARYYKNVLENNDGAMKILTDESITTFQALATEWDSLFSRYKEIVSGPNGILSREFTGINDKRVGTTVTAANEAHYGYSLGSTVDIKVGSSIDVRAMTAQSTLDRLAAQFATIEFLLVRKITPSVSFTPASLENVDPGTGGNSGMPFDQHYMGHMVGVYLNSMYWLNFNALLLELIRNLKVAGIFDDTLIYMANEFNRSPRDSGAQAGGGSDHGPQAGHVSLISGRIPKFKLIGNIYRDSAGNGTEVSKTYQGTWGHYAPIGGEPLNIIQVWGSVMALLGMPIPEIPNVVDKTRLIFKTAGSPVPLAPFNSAVNINNKAGG